MRSTAIITGVTKGLGRALALAFAERGHAVAGLYASDDAAAAALRTELEQLGASALIWKGDVRAENADFWERREVREAEHLVLINNASAPFTPQPIHLLPWEEWATLLEVSLHGTWQCSRAVLRPMAKARRGTIVNVLTSALRASPPKGFAAYLAAKHAVRGFTESLAVELAGKGVRVFSVSPPFMHTALTAGWDPRLVEAIRANSPQAHPADVAGRIRALVEDPTTPGQGEDHLV